MVSNSPEVQLIEVAPSTSFGLSYTTFSFDEVTVKSSPMLSVDDAVTIAVKITNTGSVVGSEVVQIYVTLPKGHLTHPQNQLRAFQKVKDLAPGSMAEVELVLDKYAVSYWDDVIGRWRADRGEYVVKVGGSSDKIEREARFEVGRALEWTGL